MLLPVLHSEEILLMVAGVVRKALMEVEVVLVGTSAQASARDPGPVDQMREKVVTFVACCGLLELMVDSFQL